jgi:uncharacterized NAD-dependent epimerase/dehydratase family protein
MSDVIIHLPKDKGGGRHMAVLIDHSLDTFKNKTAVALLRFRPHEVVCVIDPGYVGGDLNRMLGSGSDVPVVGNVDDAIELGATQLVIGVATPGGFLPPELRPIVYDAIRHRMNIISGLHSSIDGDPNLASLAARHAVEITNVRRVSALTNLVGSGKARHGHAFRLLTVGTDPNSGKTTTSLMLERWFLDRKVKLRFVATGQDGMLVKGRGVCVDRCITDFASGAVESLVMHEARGRDLVVVEGPDALMSPCYSPVAMAVLHGTCPDAMILCHVPTRKLHRHTDVPIAPLADHIAAYELLVKHIHPAKVVAISMNTMGMDDDEAAEVLAKTAAETGLPVADPVREGEAGAARLGNAVAAIAAACGKPLLGPDGRALRAGLSSTSDRKAVVKRSAVKAKIGTRPGR